MVDNIKFEARSNKIFPLSFVYGIKFVVIFYFIFCSGATLRSKISVIQNDIYTKIYRQNDRIVYQKREKEKNIKIECQQCLDELYIVIRKCIYV